MGGSPFSTAKDISRDDLKDLFVKAWEYPFGQDPIQYHLAQVAHQDQRALWHLADRCIPADVKDMAKLWKMEHTLVEMWRNAFIAGWREALRDIKGEQ